MIATCHTRPHSAYFEPIAAEAARIVAVAGGLDPASPVPLQHGLPGTVEVEVARVSPATLVLHAVGKRLGVLPGAPTAGARGGGTP